MTFSRTHQIITVILIFGFSLGIVALWHEYQQYLQVSNIKQIINKELHFLDNGYYLSKKENFVYGRSIETPSIEIIRRFTQSIWINTRTS